MIVSDRTTTPNDCALTAAQAQPVPIPRYLNKSVARCSPATGSIRVETATTLDGLAALKTQWRALETATATGTNGFQSFDWCYAWSSTHCDATGAEPYVVTVYDAGRLVLIWPLMVTCAGPFCVLRWLSDPFSQYGDVIAHHGPQLDTYLETAWRDICANSNAAAIRLRHVRADARSHDFLRARCVLAEKPDTAPYLDLSAFADEAAYDQRYTRTQRRRRKRIHKQLQHYGDIKFTVLDEPGHLDGLIDRIITEKKTWLRNRGHYSEPFAGSNCIAFLKQLAAQPNSNLKVVTSVLTAGERPLAYEIGLRYKNRHMCFITAHDNQLTDLSPGRLHMDYSQRGALTDGFGVFDLMVPGAPHKQSWSSDAVQVCDYYAALSWKGEIFGRGFLQFARPALRRLYHATPGGLRRKLMPLVSSTLAD